MNKIQQPEDPIESLIIGFSICIIGLGLCFYGAELIKVSFIMLCVLTINMFLLEVF